MEKMEFIYTSGWEKFEQYCKELYRGYLNRYCQDVFRYLINISMSEENACYWTEVIRKGQFADKYEKGNNKNEADYFDDSEVEMFKAVKYLPSEILVLTTYELYKRCAVQNKITQIRDLERQKEWFGYRGN